MSTRSRLRSLVLVALAAGCARSPGAAPVRADAGPKASAPPSATPPPGPPPLAKSEVVTLMESLARVHADHAKDCARLTTELEVFEKAHAGELSRALPPAYAAIEADPALAERLGHAMETVMTASMACSKEPRFVALHERRLGRPLGVPPASAAPSASAAARASAAAFLARHPVGARP